MNSVRAFFFFLVESFALEPWLTPEAWRQHSEGDMRRGNGLCSTMQRTVIKAWTVGAFIIIDIAMFGMSTNFLHELLDAKNSRSLSSLV